MKSTTSIIANTLKPVNMTRTIAASQDILSGSAMKTSQHSVDPSVGIFPSGVSHTIGLLNSMLILWRKRRKLES